MKLGLFGGSFDPIHWGHVRPVLEAVEELGLDRVIYLPTGRPPHKPHRRMAPALARYAMTELALLELDRLWVSGQELSETAPSYTIDTLLHFRSSAPDDQLHLLIGADSFVELHSWYRFEEILELAEIAVLARPGLPPVAAEGAPGGEDAGGGSGDAATGAQEGRPAGHGAPVTPVAPGARVRFVANRSVAVSSTEVRRCLGRGERPPADWVPDPVVDFALKYRLYR